MGNKSSSDFSSSKCSSNNYSGNNKRSIAPINEQNELSNKKNNIFMQLFQKNAIETTNGKLMSNAQVIYN